MIIYDRRRVLPRLLNTPDAWDDINSLKRDTTSNRIQKWDPLRAMKTFIRKKVGDTT